jgi:hypothetical protein
MTLFMAGCFMSQAQYGVAVKLDRNNYSDWFIVDAPNNDQLFRSDLTLGFNYWFRLKERRVEFLPEVTYTLRNNEDRILGVVPDNIYDIGVSRIGFQFHTQIYPLDFEGDCNCPTWGKDGEFLNKGLFFALSPGVDYFVTDLNVNSQDLESDNFLSFKIGVGGGIDIGISKQTTLTPFVMFNIYPQVSGTLLNDLNSNLCPTCDIVSAETTNTQLQFGLRFHYRPDYKF